MLPLIENVLFGYRLFPQYQYRMSFPMCLRNSEHKQY